MNRSIRILAALLVVVGVLATFNFRAYLTSPVQALEEPMLFDVAPGASLSGVAYSLNQRGVLPRPYLFIGWGRFTGQAALLKAGEYELQPGASPKSLLDLFVAGTVKMYPVIILEGWTIRDVRNALAASPELKPAMNSLSAAEIRTALGIEVSHLEGQFYPETYLVPRGTTDLSVLSQAAELMRLELEVAWDERVKGLPLKNPYELLILASIVERETALDSERSKVAGVFIRRLNKRMKLQTDPTVIYGLDESYDGNLTRKHLQTDTPYNTYTRRGLPPTPIGMPSAASLRAAAHPDDGDALFFVATGESDGSHVFSRTLDEHNAAVAAYIAKLRQQRRTGK
jgi:UPF0755 protein